LAELLLLVETKSDGTSTDGRPPVVHKVSALGNTFGIARKTYGLFPSP
jgi:hypothetical protein